MALDRAKANGLDYEWTAFADEELAIQAVLERPDGHRLRHALCGDAAGQGAGADHLPAVEAKVLSLSQPRSTAKLADLDGEPILLHSRGGGTDAIANVIESKEGITFGERSYVPGSANRVVALVAGQANATIIDLSNKNKVMRQHGDKFNVLPMFDVEASDEALFRQSRLDKGE